TITITSSISVKPLSDLFRYIRTTSLIDCSVVPEPRGRVFPSMYCNRQPGADLETDPRDQWRNTFMRFQRGRNTARAVKRTAAPRMMRSTGSIAVERFLTA